MEKAVHEKPLHFRTLCEWFLEKMIPAKEISLFDYHRGTEFSNRVFKRSFPAELSREFSNRDFKQSLQRDFSNEVFERVFQT